MRASYYEIPVKEAHSQAGVLNAAALSSTQPLTQNIAATVFRIAVAASAATSFAVLLTLTGCASAPIPTEQFAVSKTAIDSATTAGATEYAPLELKTARDKLDAAQRAVDEKDYRAASALAQEAQFDAKLAETKALSEKAKKSVAETQDNLRTLLNEVNRNNQQDSQRSAKP